MRAVIFLVVTTFFIAAAYKDAIWKKKFHLEKRVKANFFKAMELCASKGMRLATFDTEAEYKELVKTVKSQAGTDKPSYWLSGQDLGEYNRWTWLSNGKPLNYTKWAKGEPNHAGLMENCIEVWFDPDHLMNDQHCYLERHFVCETYRPNRC